MDRARGVLRAETQEYLLLNISFSKDASSLFLRILCFVGAERWRLGGFHRLPRVESLMGDGDICTAFVVCTGPQRQIGGERRESDSLPT